MWGVACVDGSCPKANADEYAERDMDVVRNCKDCHYYEGCKDCALYHTNYCPESMDDSYCQTFSP